VPESTRPNKTSLHRQWPPSPDFPPLLAAAYQRNVRAASRGGFFDSVQPYLPPTCLILRG